jgi:hypothetical protein
MPVRTIRAGQRDTKDSLTPIERCPTSMDGPPKGLAQRVQPRCRGNHIARQDCGSAESTMLLNVSYDQAREQYRGFDRASRWPFHVRRTCPQAQHCYLSEGRFLRLDKATTPICLARIYSLMSCAGISHTGLATSHAERSTTSLVFQVPRYRAISNVWSHGASAVPQRQAHTNYVSRTWHGIDSFGVW